MGYLRASLLQQAWQQVWASISRRLRRVSRCWHCELRLWLVWARLPVLVVGHCWLPRGWSRPAWVRAADVAKSWSRLQSSRSLQWLQSQSLRSRLGWTWPDVGRALAQRCKTGTLARRCCRRAATFDPAVRSRLHAPRVALRSTHLASAGRGTLRPRRRCACAAATVSTLQSLRFPPRCHDLRAESLEILQLLHVLRPLFGQ